MKHRSLRSDNKDMCMKRELKKVPCRRVSLIQHIIEEKVIIQ